MLVQRANVILEINEHDVDFYVQKGFDVLNEDGTKVVIQSVPTDINQLQDAFRKHTDKIKSLDEEVSKLKSLNEQLKAEIVELKAKPKVEPKETTKKTTTKKVTETPKAEEVKTTKE